MYDVGTLTVTTYSADEVVRFTGASMSQIEHLVKSGVVIPAAEAPRRGVSRRFSLLNAIEIMLALQLVKLGMSVRNAGKVLTFMTPQAERLPSVSEIQAAKDIISQEGFSIKMDFE